ncbi:MAG: RidA family protein [Xanthomonadales bacterium]|nr:RidA family protein [Xanthomonadales bacterium]
MNNNHSGSAPSPVGAYPLARKVGDLLFLSGVGPRQAGSDEVPGNRVNAEGKLVGYDIELQCHAVFENVRIILEQSGLALTDLVDVTVYLTDMNKDFQVFNQLWAQYFRTGQPCRTTVEVRALPTPIAIELKCVAYAGQKP